MGYQNEVKRLIKLLNDSKQHHEAVNQIRTLFKKVVLMPREEGGLSVDLARRSGRHPRNGLRRREAAERER